MNSSTPLVTADKFESVTPPSKEHPHTKRIPTVRNSVTALFGVLSLWMGIQTFTSNPVVDARAKLGRAEDKLLDPENMDLTTTDFDNLTPTEQMELRSLCEKIGAIPEEWYKDKEGKNIKVTTQRMHEIANVLIDEFDKEQNSDKKYMIIWLLVSIISWLGGTALASKYKKQDKNNAAAYYHSLFDEVKEYRRDGLEKNAQSTRESIERMVDGYINDLRMNHNVVYGVVYNPVDEPLQAFIAEKIAHLVQVKKDKVTDCTKLLMKRIEDLDVAANPDAVKRITLDTEFQSLLTQTQTSLDIVKNQIAEEERELGEQQRKKEEQNRKLEVENELRQQAKGVALLLLTDGLIDESNKEAVTHFLDEMRDGRVVEQDVTDLLDLQRNELQGLLDRQTEITTLTEFVEVADFELTGVDDFSEVQAEYARILDLHTRSTALGYTEMTMDSATVDFGNLNQLQLEITSLNEQLEQDDLDVVASFDFTDETFDDLEGKANKKQQLTEELKNTTEKYKRDKKLLETLLKTVKTSIDVFLGDQESKLTNDIDSMRGNHTEQEQRQRTLVEMRTKWSTQKQEVLNQMMSHIEGGVADEKLVQQGKLSRLLDDKTLLDKEEQQLEEAITQGSENEGKLNLQIIPLLTTLNISADDVDYFGLLGEIDGLLDTDLPGSPLPIGCMKIRDIVGMKTDGGYTNKAEKEIVTYMNAEIKNDNRVLRSILVRLNSLGQLTKLLEERNEIVGKLDENKKKLGVVKDKISNNNKAIETTKELLEQLESQLENSEKKKAALDILKEALARVIDGIVSVSHPVTYDTLEEAQKAFDLAVEDVIFERKLQEAHRASLPNVDNI